MARKALKTIEIDDEIDENEDENDEKVLTFDDLLTDFKENQDLDVFEDMGPKAADVGMYLFFDLYRDAIYLGRRSHPYSWHQLQKEFGGGNIRVDVRHPNTKAYIKRTSRIVAGAPKEFIEEVKQERREYTQQPPQPPQQNIAEIMATMAGVIAPIISLISGNKQSSTPDNMGNLVTQLQQSQMQSSQMILNMMQNFMETSRKEAQNSLEFQTKMLDKLTEKLEKSSNKSDSYTAADILRATQDAQENGFKLFTQLQSMAENIADEKISLLPAPSEGKKGAIDSIIESMMPVIAQGIMAQKQAAAEPQQRQGAAARNPQTDRPLTPRPRNIFPRTEFPKSAQPVPEPVVVSPVSKPQNLPRVQFVDDNVTPSTLVENSELVLFQNKWFPKIIESLGDLFASGNLTIDNAMQALDTNQFEYVTFVSEISETTIATIANDPTMPRDVGQKLLGIYARCQNNSRNAYAAPAKAGASAILETSDDGFGA